LSGLVAGVRDFKDGEIIFSEFEKGDKFYLIQSGKVELVKFLGNVQKTLDVLTPSDMFGEMALLEDSPRTATAIAQGDTKLMVFDKNNFQNLMMSNPHVALKLLKMFVKRIYEAKRRFMILTLREPNARVADVFLMLDETTVRADAKFDTSRREFNTTVNNIASWGGLNTAQAKESIDYYTKLGYLEVYKDKIIVKDINNFIRVVNTARTRHSQK